MSGTLKKDSFWKDHIKAQEKLGVSIRQYCSDKGLSPSRMSYHKRRLKDKNEADFLQLIPSPKRPSLTPEEEGAFKCNLSVPGAVMVELIRALREID